MQPTPPLAALVAVLLLVAAGPAPALALPSDEQTRSVAVGGDPGAFAAQTSASASFGDEDLTVTRGDEVTFTVSHSGPANVTLGGPDYGFHLVVSLGGSGTSEVTIDTYATTAADPDEFVDGGDATLLSKPLSKPLMPSDYLLSVSVDGDERDVATLTVEPRGEMRAESFVAPAEFGVTEYAAAGDDADVGPLREIMSGGNTVAVGDYAVMRVEESSLETALNPDRLTGDAASNGVKWNVSQVAPEPNSETGEYTAGVHEEANVTVLPVFEEDVVYFVWDTSALSDDLFESQPERNEYEARLTLTAENGLVAEDTVVASARFRLVEPEASLEPADDAVQYPWENDTFVVRGTTTRAPNTTLEVRLRSPKPDAFLLISEATVDANREYEATIDLDGATRGVTATLWTDEFYPETAREVTLVAPNASVVFDDQSPDDAAVTLSFVEVPEGGFVRIHDAEGNGVGRSDYLAPGRHENVGAGLSLPLYEAQTLRAELVRDSDGDAAYSRNDTEYARSGWVVNDTARVAFGSPPTETPAATPTRTATPTATPTPSATPYPVLSETPLSPSGASATGVSLSPAVVVAALLAAAGLFARRTEREDE